MPEWAFDPNSLARDLDRFRKALRQRATVFAKNPRGACDFPAEVKLFVQPLRARVEALRRGADNGFSKEDRRMVKLRVAEALSAAAAFLEARLFEDFEGTTGREGAADALFAAADLLELDRWGFQPPSRDTRKRSRNALKGVSRRRARERDRGCPEPPQT